MRSVLVRCPATLCLLFLLVDAPCDAADWPQFRGPNGLGVSDSSGTPVSWSESHNVAWRTELPGAGTSSPIVVDDRIYLTCYSGYGLDAAAPGEMRDLVRHLVILDRKSGKILDTKDFRPELPESEYQGGNDSRHGYSSATPATDGQRLYLFFGKSGVYCLDLDGRELWRQSVGDGTRGWGSSNSPVLHQNLVIVNASVESGEIVGLDKLTGEPQWSTAGMRSSWNTPALVPLADGNTELVVSVQGSILGLDPTSGQQLWHCSGIPTYVCPSVVWNEGIVYATGGRGTQYTLAIRAGGRGDVTDSHLLWKVARGSNVSSPVYQAGHLFVMNDSKGIAFCFDAKDGRLVYEERLKTRPGRVYSSPLAVGGNILFVSQHNGTFVLPAAPRFEIVAHNTFSDDDSRSNASPVAHGGQLLLRNDRYLYCIGDGGS